MNELQIPPQDYRVLMYMREHGSITQRDAIKLGCYRLSARIYDLKKRWGYTIATTYEKVTNKDGTIAVIGRYSLREKDEKKSVPEFEANLCLAQSAVWNTTGRAQ